MIHRAIASTRYCFARATRAYFRTLSRLEGITSAVIMIVNIDLKLWRTYTKCFVIRSRTYVTSLRESKHELVTSVEWKTKSGGIWRRMTLNRNTKFINDAVLPPSLSPLLHLPLSQFLFMSLSLLFPSVNKLIIRLGNFVACNNNVNTFSVFLPKYKQMKLRQLTAQGLLFAVRKKAPNECNVSRYELRILNR